mmetsp:Transcript_28947/g.82281  ORF Transcript_28947/g.82281 Transcript_28947/m.82281 type:complete len:360 (-) Transcript_28947:28-1107(-)
MQAPTAYPSLAPSASLKPLKQQLSLPRIAGQGAATDRACSMTGSPWRGSAAGPAQTPAARSGSLSALRDAHALSKSRSLTQIPLKREEVRDPTYEHLLGKACGPGAPSRWPLGHDSRYRCHLDDMRLVATLWDAYEVGFRGRKRARMTEDQVMYGVSSPRALSIEDAGSGGLPIRTAGSFPQNWCDGCGTTLSDGESPGHLWYCRKCKARGSRFELCLECHAAEVLQSEGKHASGPGAPHPHLLRCEHRALERRTSLRTLYPGTPHLHCALCDVCGDYIVGLKGADDRVAVVGRRGTAAVEGAACGASNKPIFKAPGSGEMFCCPRCPEDSGVRFEVCPACAAALLDIGEGIHRLTALL